MIRHMREAVADMRRDVARWKVELEAVEKADAAEWVKDSVGDRLRSWIAEGETIINDSGY
jgi:hypothetical protein